MARGHMGGFGFYLGGQDYYNLSIFSAIFNLLVGLLPACLR
jgi:hypothetical protein